MVFYIILFEMISTITMMSVSVILMKYKNAKTASQMKPVKKSPQTLVDKVSISSNFLGKNKRHDFRVPVKIPYVTLQEFENEKLAKLKYRKFEGQLENISIGGMKLVSNCNLPIT